jgi:uncharacterized membrane protein YheB (UPF0754 family)
MTIDKNILSIDSDDDDKNYKAFSEYLEDDTKRKRNLTAKEINEIGENLLKEIERKKRNEVQKSSKLIPYILKNCDEKYDIDELKGYCYNDVLDIYNELKTQKQSFISKFFHFIFNL